MQYADALAVSAPFYSLACLLVHRLELESYSKAAPGFQNDSTEHSSREQNEELRVSVVCRWSTVGYSIAVPTGTIPLGEISLGNII